VGGISVKILLIPINLFIENIKAAVTTDVYKKEKKE
jgi:hypothetical protein